MSIALSFQRLIGLRMRSWNRFSCSSSFTENQYFTRIMPERISISSKRGHDRMNSRYSSSVQKPMTRSTLARLYQLRSNRTISPAEGNSATYRWKYHCPRSLSVVVERVVDLADSEAKARRSGPVDDQIGL